MIWEIEAMTPLEESKMTLGPRAKAYHGIGEDGMTDEERVLKQVIEAWEALPEGHHSPRTIEQWLHEHMKPAIDAARAITGCKNQ